MFSYSPRAGTAAAVMPHPVHGDIKKVRSRVLHEVAERQKRAYAARYHRRTLPVLWEGVRTPADSSPEIYGYTPNYLKVGMPVGANQGATLSYRISPVLLAGMAPTGDYLLGENAMP